jgi:hypothetical protein
MTQLAFEFEPGRLDRVNDVEAIKAMDRLRFRCGKRWPGPWREYHAPHAVVDQLGAFECPGLVTRSCGQVPHHRHHRWFEPGRMYWCEGLPPGHWCYARPPYIAPPMNGDLPSTRG